MTLCLDLCRAFRALNERMEPIFAPRRSSRRDAAFPRWKLEEPAPWCHIGADASFLSRPVRGFLLLPALVAAVLVMMIHQQAR
ncbi:hypothetical protein [Roseicella sp. DB1501]|uniref:hypothetical protein n=1 Tax=Roseicella sp. DB1501 TaxID=2730925 RepID=UPI001490E69B|nr:hypothetical protein [Roseicella sp. DB1501]NOG72434.1 hypothetical protein [Roseicella sp. DB1501]